LWVEITTLAYLFLIAHQYNNFLALIHFSHSYTSRIARIVVRNKTPFTFYFLVQHSFLNFVLWVDGDMCLDPQDYWLGVLEPGEGREIFNVNYKTGFLAGMFSGSNLWTVNGIKLIQEESELNHLIFFIFLGQFSDFTLVVNNQASNQNQTYYYKKLQQYQSNVGHCFKKHSLRAEDDGKTTYIIVMDSKVEINSPSGTTTTSFDELGTFTSWIKKQLATPRKPINIKGGIATPRKPIDIKGGIATPRRLIDIKGFIETLRKFNIKRGKK
jgi:hypothetical protein